MLIANRSRGLITSHVFCYFMEKKYFCFLKVFKTLSVPNERPSAINAAGAVNASLRTPGFATLPAVPPAGQPRDHASRNQDEMGGGKKNKRD